jgi:apolipoprotein D and lipocalin family protein
MRRLFAASLAVLSLVAAGHALAAPPAAPEPAQPVDKDRLYLGIWHEVARTPNDDTKGCVAGETRFTTNDDGVLTDRESCRMGDPNTGKERILEGPVTFPNPANPAKFHTSHRVLGLFSAGSDYWVLDHDAAYTWFIAATPSFKSLSIFTRDPQIPVADRDQLVNRAGQLGYDVTKLEFPPQPKG